MKLRVCQIIRFGNISHALDMFLVFQEMCPFYNKSVNYFSISQTTTEFGAVLLISLIKKNRNFYAGLVMTSFSTTLWYEILQKSCGVFESTLIKNRSLSLKKNQICIWLLHIHSINSLPRAFRSLQAIGSISWYQWYPWN